MTKEEIFKKHWDRVTTVPLDETTISYMKYVLDAMDEYAEQKAIEFAKWIEDGPYIYHSKHFVWVSINDSSDRLRPQELYSLFNSQSK